MSRLLHTDLSGLDSKLLANRVDQEVQDAKPPDDATAEPSRPGKNTDAIVILPMTIPPDGAFPADGGAPPPAADPLSSNPLSPNPGEPNPLPTRSWLQRLRQRGKAAEQAIHLWLYRYKYLKEDVARIRAMVEDANGRIIALQTGHSPVRDQHGALADALRKTAEIYNAHLNDIAIDRAALGRDLASLRRDLSVLQGDMLFQRRRLARLADGLPAEDTIAAPSEPAAEPTDGVDAMYVGFEERFRGTWPEIKERLRPHVGRLRARRPLAPGKPLLDLGCGRGEWLELLGEAGIEAYGIDSNANAIAACQRRGLPARHGDALAHLASLPDGALGAISVFHVIEHLPTALLLRLLDEARRTLIPGGLLMLETPNPESIKVGATTFHADPTHLRPIPPQLAEFLVDRCGFIAVEVVRLNPYPESAFIREDTEAARRINELMYGPQDYAVIAQRA